MAFEDDRRELEGELYDLVYRQVMGYFQLATPSLSPAVGGQILKLITDSGVYIKAEDIVDGATSGLIDQLVTRNNSLEAMIEKTAATDFVNLDRDTWRNRCLEAERRSENLSQQIARETY